MGLFGAVFFSQVLQAFRILMQLRSILSVVLVALVFTAGCSGSGRIRHSSPQGAFEKGLEAYESEDYERAVEYFRAVFSYGRGNEWAADAQLYLARAYRADERYALAATEYQRFVRLYSSDPRVPQARFGRALTFYARSPMYQLDQTYTHQALDAFQLFIDRYPTHERVPEAEAYIEELQEKLAHKQYHAAQLYEQRELWEAAALSYEMVFDQYPQTVWADDALFGAIRTYIEFAERSIRAKQEERYEQAIDNYRLLTQIFPESPLLQEAEALYQEARARLAALGARRPSVADTNGASDGRA